MKHIFLKYTFYSLLCFGFVACEVAVDVDLDVEPRPVLNALLSPDNSFAVMLSESIPYENYTPLYKDENKVPEFTDAVVSITPNEGNSFDLNYEVLPEEVAYFLPVNGVYKHPSQPQYGKTYTVTAQIEGYKTLTASTTFPFPVQIEKIDTSSFFGKIDPLDIGAEAETYLKFNVQFQNPSNERNYYGLKIRNTNGIHPYYVFPAYQNIDRNLPRYRGFQLFSDEFLEDATVDFEVWIDYYSLFNNNYFYPDPYGYYPDTIQYSDLEVVLGTFSPEMYDYIISAEKQTLSDGIIEELFFEPVNVFSNVKNGLGIFAAFSTDTILVDLTK